MSQKIAQRLLRVASTPEGFRLLSGFLYPKSAAKSDRSKRFTWGKGDIDLKIKGVSPNPKKAMEFPTQEAMKKYLDEHPGADKSIHHVVETKPKPKAPEAPKKKEPIVPTIKTWRETLDFFSYKNPTYREWSESLSNKEKKAINSYTYKGDHDMNSLLRFGEITSSSDYDKTKDQIDTLKNALERFRLTESVYVYRGTDFDAIPKELLDSVLQGKTNPEDVRWIDNGFVSTSVEENHPFRDREVRCRIALPEGTNGGYIASLSDYREEAEFLLPPDYTFQLIKVRKSSLDGNYDIDVEVLPKG